MKSKTLKPSFNSKVASVRKALPKEVTNTEKPIYRISIDEDDINDEICARIIISGKEQFNFDCLIENLPHCCGSFELGAINTSNCFTFKSLPDFPKYIKEVFDKLFTEIFDHIEMYGKTLIINTIPTPACKELETYLSTCKFFTKVKEWKNSGSGNLITMWVSNN